MNTKPTKDYADQIKRIRARMGLTQVNLAERLGVSFPTVNRWENAKASPSQLSWNRLLEIAGEIDPDSQIAEPEPPPYGVTLPILDFTANPDIVRSLVEGERLSFGHLANPAFATEIASIDPLPHQRIAVYDHMLKQARLRFLLADDAGAGKTIMTGLYIREMLSRRLLKRVLIVPPAGLVGNWQRELQLLFSLPFNIVSGSDAKNNNPFIGPQSDRVIISVDTLVGERVFARIAEDGVEPYELVVFDEAHKLSCDQGADYRIRKTGRYKLAEAVSCAQNSERGWHLSWHAHHLLLLTATPHMGKEYPYYALWRLLEPEVLTTPEAFDQFPTEQRRHYFIRRTKEEMVRLDGNPLYPKRHSDTLGYALSQGEVSEQRLYDETTEYLRYVYNRAKLLNQSAARLAMGVFQRRLASSTYALLCSLERRIEKLDKIIDDVQSGRLSIEQLLTIQRRIREEDDVFESKSADEENAEDDAEENEVSEDKLLQGVIVASLADLVVEKEQVLKLRELADQVYNYGVESKFEKLREVISEEKYSREKFLVFTEHRDTLKYLVRRLSGMGYTGQIAQIHGGMHYTERQEQIERFRKPTEESGMRFMICTDAAAEGVNLQFCWIMINYDIPWNPARLEQRMGRIHRYGQKHDPVIILNLVAPATREGRVLKILLDKIEKIRKQLKSDKVFDSIGRLFSEISIKTYMERVASGDDINQIARELDGRLTKEQVKAIQDQERRLFGNGGDVMKELPRLRESIEHETFFRLLPGYVRKFVVSTAPLVGLKVEGDLGAYFNFQSAQKGAIDPLLTAIDTYPPTQSKRLSILRPDDRQSCVWIHPGEPVFESFRELVRQKLGKEALRGSVFVDPTVSKPYLFHVARLTVIRKADPEISELSHEETVECRLVGVKQTESAEISACPVEHLSLLRGGQGLPPQAQRMAVEAYRQLGQARAYLTERVCRSLAVECRERRMVSLPERESFVRRGYDFQEAELANARAKMSQKARAGNKGVAAELTHIKSQQRDLSDRLERSLNIIRREPELLVPGDVAFIAHALVVPSTDPAELEWRDANVEQMAMDMAKAFEEAEGAAVKFVCTPKLARAADLPDHPGFDILSLRAGNQQRCIEVKGRVGAGDVEITDNEWARACNLRDDYWLYVVYHCGTATPQLVRVQDPFGNLLVRPFSRTQEIERTSRCTVESGGVRIGHARIMEVAQI
jgi:superfamily II DNA or RNA helicase/DNA-binding XRE family transcriptional regulator